MLIRNLALTFILLACLGFAFVLMQPINCESLIEEPCTDDGCLSYYCYFPNHYSFLNFWKENGIVR